MSETSWNSWCRLCGRQDIEIKVTIHTDKIASEFSEETLSKLTLKDALEKFFEVHSSQEDILPKHLCLDCFSMVTSVIQFFESIQRVQQMYKYLEMNRFISSDLQALRKQFQVSNENREMCTNYPNQLSETVNTEINNDTCCLKLHQYDFEETLKTEIGEDDCFIELLHQSHFEDFSEANGIEIDKEIEIIEDNSQEDQLTWDEQSEDSICGNDDTITSTSKLAKSKAQVAQNSSKKNFTDDFNIDLKCLACGMDFELYSTYCKHVEAEHGNVINEKYCPMCNRNLKTWYHLGRHMRTHMPMQSRFPTKCHKCDKNFSSIKKLELHIERKHRNPQKYVCEICGFCATSNYTLTLHMYKHNGKPFECELCKRRFRLKYDLNLHMDIHGSNKYICTICGKQLNSRNTLRNHFLVHSEEKRHKCDHCGKGFKQSKSLKAHLITHVGIKPYACNFCDRSFSARTPCRQHMAKQHPAELASLEASGKKAYTDNVPKLETLRELAKSGNSFANEKISDGDLSCFKCERSFRSRAARAAHMKTKHPEDFVARQKARVALSQSTQLKPLICIFCSRSFAHAKLYRSHLNRVHPHESTNEIYCILETESGNELSEAFENILPDVATIQCLTDIAPED